MPKHATRPFSEELPTILKQRQMTQKDLALAAGIDRSYLSRALRGLEPPSLDLIARATRALDLPDDYFLETQRARILQHLEASPDATRTIYRRLVRTHEIGAA